MARITLGIMRFHAHHGLFEEERKIGGEYEVTVSYDQDIENVEKTDIIEDTLDYALVYELVKEEMAKESKLIEHVSARILRHLIERFGKKNWRLRFSKKHPPVCGELERATIELSESDLKL